MTFKGNSMRALPVLLLLAVPAVAAPRLGLSATTVGPINTLRGGNGPTQTVQAYNLGDGTLSLTASSSAPWLSATVGARVACGQASGGCSPVSIVLNSSSLTPGKYTEWITLTDPKAIDSPQDIMVTVDTTGVPDTINLFVTPSGDPFAQATVAVQSSGTGIQPTVATTSGGSWLSFNSGNIGIVNLGVPWILQATARPGQAAGTYQGTVKLTGSSITAENKTINVTLNVTTAPIIDTVRANTTVRLSAPQGGAKASGSASFFNLGDGTLSVSGATATSSIKFLSAAVQNNTVQISADPTGLAPGVYSGTVGIQSNAANSSLVAIPVELTVAAPTPMINAGGVVNIGDYQNDGVAPGDIVAIFGTQLAPTTVVAPSVPLATTLSGVQVLVNGVPAPLFFVSSGQINFQVPYSLTPGQIATVQVNSGATTGNIRAVNVLASSPKLLPVATPAGSYGIFINLDGSLTWPVNAIQGCNCRPAKPGDIIVMFGVGFGQTTPGATEGAAGAAQSIAGANVSFGGLFVNGVTYADSLFTGLVPGLVGLYQINVKIPADLIPAASIPVQVKVSGGISNSVNIAVSK